MARLHLLGQYIEDLLLGDLFDDLLGSPLDSLNQHRLSSLQAPDSMVVGQIDMMPRPL